jgi:hypothetical protein
LCRQTFSLGRGPGVDASLVAEAAGAVDGEVDGTGEGGSWVGSLGEGGTVGDVVGCGLDEAGRAIGSATLTVAGAEDAAGAGVRATVRPETKIREALLESRVDGVEVGASEDCEGEDLDSCLGGLAGGVETSDEGDGERS